MDEDRTKKLIERLEERKARVEQRLPEGKLRDLQLENIDKRIEFFSSKIDAPQMEIEE